MSAAEHGEDVRYEAEAMPRLGHDSTIMRGVIVGADFFPEDAPEGHVIIHVAVPADHSIGKSRVAVIEEEYFNSTLPTFDKERAT